MKDELTTKNIRISNEALSCVKQVSKDSNRNITGAAEYLILKGFETYLNELKILNSISQGNAKTLPI